MIEIANKDPGNGHFIVSMLKSALRMVGAGGLIMGGYYLEEWGSWIMLAGVAFLIAETLGVIEEIV